MLLITGLILTGLIVDLGGGPDHSRRGFQVRPLPLPHLVPAGLLRRSICVLVLEEPWPYRRRRARQLGAHGPLLGHPFRLCPGCVLVPGYGARRDVRLFRPFIVLVAADLILSPCAALRRRLRARGRTSPRPFAVCSTASSSSTCVHLSITVPDMLTIHPIQILGILITGMLVPYNDPDLLNGAIVPVFLRFAMLTRRSFALQASEPRLSRPTLLP